MGSKPKTPKEDPAAKALRKRQAEQLLQLDEEANTRIKRMYSAASGLRIARGTADSRLPAADTAGTPATANYGLVASGAPGLTKQGPRKGKFPGKILPGD